MGGRLHYCFQRRTDVVCRWAVARFPRPALLCEAPDVVGNQRGCRTRFHVLWFRSFGAIIAVNYDVAQLDGREFDEWGFGGIYLDVLLGIRADRKWVKGRTS